MRASVIVLPAIDREAKVVLNGYDGWGSLSRRAPRDRGYVFYPTDIDKAKREAIAARELMKGQS